jgi:N-acetylmuramoyl-L-alanine amidase CwlA
LHQQYVYKTKDFVWVEGWMGWHISIGMDKICQITPSHKLTWHKGSKVVCIVGQDNRQLTTRSSNDKNKDAL